MVVFREVFGVGIRQNLVGFDCFVVLVLLFCWMLDGFFVGLVVCFAWRGCVVCCVVVWFVCLLRWFLVCWICLSALILFDFGFVYLLVTWSVVFD